MTVWHVHDHNPSIWHFHDLSLLVPETTFGSPDSWSQQLWTNVVPVLFVLGSSKLMTNTCHSASPATQESGLPNVVSETSRLQSWKRQTVTDVTFYFVHFHHLSERDYILFFQISRTWKNIFTNGLFHTNRTPKDSTLCEGFFLILLELGEPLNLRVNFFVPSHGTIKKTMLYYR